MDGKQWGTSGSEGGSNRTICCLRPRPVLLLSCILWAEALLVLCLCWEAGSWDGSGLGTERRVGSGPRSRGPLSLFPLCLPSPNSLWVHVIRPKWVTVCTPAVWLCPAQGTSLPRRSSSWKGTRRMRSRQKRLMLLTEDSFPTTKVILGKITHLQKSQPEKFNGVLCFGSFRGKRVPLAPKAHLDYPASQ